MALPSRYELEPDHPPRRAVEQRVEREEGVCNKRRYYGRPCTEEHHSVRTTARREDLEVLDKNSHLDQEAEGAVDDLRSIRPLYMLGGPHEG